MTAGAILVQVRPLTFGALGGLFKGVQTQLTASLAKEDVQQAAMQLASEPRASAGMQQRTVIGGADFKFGPEWPRYRPQTVYHAPTDLALEDARERGAFPCVVDEGGGNEQTSSGRVAEKL